MFNNPFKKKPEASRTIYEYELLSHIFSMDEAKKHLLNVVPPANVTPDAVLSDAAALELAIASKGWAIFEKAVWFKLLTALRLSLAADTLEKREGARNQVLAYLATLHLPYEMRFSADNIRHMRDLEKQVQDLKA